MGGGRERKRNEGANRWWVRERRERRGDWKKAPKSLAAAQGGGAAGVAAAGAAAAVSVQTTLGCDCGKEKGEKERRERESLRHD